MKGLFVLAILATAVLAQQAPLQGQAAAAAAAAQKPPQEEKVRYDGWKVVRVGVDTSSAEALKAQLEMVRVLVEMPEAEVAYHDSGPTVEDGGIELIVSPRALPLFRDTPIFGGVEVVIDDLQALFDSNAAREKEFPYISYEASQNEFFEAYRDYDEVMDYFDGLVADFPDVIRKVPSIGKSYEGRDIWMLIVGNRNNTNPTTAILWNGLQHCREWIAGHSHFFTIDALVRRYGSDELITELVDNMEFHVIPVLNPDGYVYTRTVNNNWRKNRMPDPDQPSCIGTDLNRNWLHEWGTIGSSSNPCSDTFHGQGPSSSPEITNIIAYLDDNTPFIQGYMDWHSSGNLFMTPWGPFPELPPDYPEMEATGNRFAAELRSYRGTNYRVGPIYHIIYAVSGSSADTTYAIFDIVHSYALEIGTSFQPNPSQIVPTGEELLLGSLVHAEDVYRRVLAEKKN